ncbi:MULTISPECIES: hypothetical protein [Haematobacter]|uniref:hypothetical protein n=1 Tax=Haematobacter TaxID=366614 RepID=UPI0023F10501|nr:MULTISPECIES: hypothetical protein [Haematobacter]
MAAYTGWQEREGADVLDCYWIEVAPSGGAEAVALVKALARQREDSVTFDLIDFYPYSTHALAA